MLVSFASAYLALFISSVAAGQQVAYLAYYFGGFAAAWAGVVGVGVTAPLVGHRRVGLVVVGAIALVLALQMLNTPVA